MIRFACGCIAFNLTRPVARDEYLVAWACDTGRDENPLGLHWRNMGDKERTVVDAHVMERLVEDLATAVNDGHAFNEVRALLRIRS